VRLSLVPKPSEFYELFAQAGANALAVARKAEAYFREYPNTSITQADIKELEHVGDNLTHDIIQLLNTQYVTPFEREDIYALAQKVDDVVDHIEHACDLLGLYRVELPSRQALDLCAILVAACELLATALANLRGRAGIQDTLVELKAREDEGDRIEREAIAALFHDARIDPLIVIRWKDIYDGLEKAIDAAEHAANLIANILVKNA
jgi:predicted phosphate transport protein (TIGR00153 family)